MKKQTVLNFFISLVCAGLSYLFLYAYVENEKSIMQTCTTFHSPRNLILQPLFFIGIITFSAFAIIMFIYGIMGEKKKNV